MCSFLLFMSVLPRSKITALTLFFIAIVKVDRSGFEPEAYWAYVSHAMGAFTARYSLYRAELPAHAKKFGEYSLLIYCLIKNRNNSGKNSQTFIKDGTN